MCKKRKDERKTGLYFPAALKAFIVGGVLMIVAVYFVIIQYLNIGTKKASFRIEVLFLSSLCILTFLAVVYAWGAAIRANKRSREKYEIQKKLNKMQTEYYHKLLSREKETRKIRHDIKSHMLIINKYLCENKFNELSSYLSQWEDSVKDIDSIINTGNEIVDIIVNEIANTTSVKWIGKVPLNLKMDQVDICILFANLLSNAEEAIRKGNLNGKIEVWIKNHNENITIQIRNPISEYVSLGLDGIPKVVKNNKLNHGYGLENVKDVVNKYQGRLRFMLEGNFIIASVFLQNVVEIT